MSQALVLLGSSGRLGSRLNAGGRAQVIGVSRSQGITYDVAVPASRRRCAAAVLAAAAGHSEIVVIDAVLDASTVTSMRDSLSGATTLGLEILDGAASEGLTVGAVVCGTTAVLAPLPFSTPYAHFKRLQLDLYASSGHPFAGLLLPRLFADAPPPEAGFALSFDDAAALAAHEATALGPRSRRLLVPLVGGRAPLVPDRNRAAASVRDALRVTRLMMQRLTTGRDSPFVQRHASQALLAALPRDLRARVDHHLAPPGRIERLARSLSVEVAPI